MAWDQAYAVARDTAGPLPSEPAAVAAATGRVLAEAVLAAVPVPAFDCAAMDGYAVTGAGPWTVVGRVLAGARAGDGSLTSGMAVEIATGAPVPVGAEAVLPYEDCRRDGVTVTGTRGPRDHIRRVGDDGRAGDTVAPAGRVVTATLAAAAVQAGVEQLRAHRRPAVSLLVTGDEVIISGTPGPGQVRDSFTGLVTAVTVRAGGEMRSSRHLRDDPALLRDALDVAGTDVVVVSGSSSAGAADHLHAELDARRATWHVRGVACRPGHPQALARLPDGRWVVSLPGNPYAGLVAALTLLEPLLTALAGRPAAPLARMPVSGVAEVRQGVRVVPVLFEGGPARIAAAGGAAGLRAAASADALAVLPTGWADREPAVILALP
ncbi:molybdopterin molybdenumtransferase MoeA [Actinoplanes sp. NEAU-A11]|uniref:Molybdopterin molybdenumtransferase n=2 Tax=Actinoplanes aureus TaxID=2792083 RepID=A0A931C8J3_9ACTN|nr:molybdopterin molybdenumtransferase MoeA [Actinoplanes aureus]